MDFKLASGWKPRGDQGQAIEQLVESLREHNSYQSLWGVTGSGKTFTMANVIEQLKRPALIMSHNKTLAAQLYSELKSFFPHNAVEYFISHYDYYQPEAYIPQTDTYIEKDASINEDIERLRMSAIASLMSRKDVVVVASISCIYSLSSPSEMNKMTLHWKVGDTISRMELLEKLTANLYKRNQVRFTQGNFRVMGENIDIFPAHLEEGLRLSFFGDELESLTRFHPLTGQTLEKLQEFHLPCGSPHMATAQSIKTALPTIEKELEERIDLLEKQNKLLEAQRLSVRTQYDLEMLREIGFCHGIENYSRHLSGREAGEKPYCLLDYFPQQSLLFMDESHVTVPQLRAMYRADRSRKERLIEYGFRLPSALDNRPLRDDEFWDMAPPCVFASATPADFELERSSKVARQMIRPTGLLDPAMEMHPATGQVEHLTACLREATAKGQRSLVTALTKRMSEDLSDHFKEQNMRVEYLHSDIDALERVEILRKLRSGHFDILVGVNLLREGLDLPEVALVAILDADKEGFLRSTTSLLQTAGRAARHVEGRVLLYADKLNKSLKKVLAITAERRRKQRAWNLEKGICPQSVQRGKQVSFKDKKEPEEKGILRANTPLKQVLKELTEEMLEAAEKLDFEKATLLRDQIQKLKKEGRKRKKRAKVE